jgi:prepilin-type N-terminal cleavage/methylation domain-containing protein
MTDRGDDGYTLIEILVSLVLLGLMATMTTNVFQQLTTVRAIQIRYEAKSNIGSVGHYIGSEISRAMAIPLSTDADGMTRSLEGTATSVRFVAATRSGFKEDALREISFSIETGNGVATVLRHTRSRTGSDSSTDTQTDELLTGIASFKLSYRSGREGGQWTESWQNEDGLPAAIRIHVTDTTNNLQVSRTVSLADDSRRFRP